MSDQFLSYDPKAADKQEPEQTQPQTQPQPAPAPVMYPSRGRGTQLDLDRSNALAGWSVTPMAHPTGVDAIDGFTSPLGAASLAAGAVGVARAGVAGGVVPAAKAAASAMSPFIKYEVYSRGLQAMGVPWYLADGIAAAAANYKRGAQGAAAGEAAEAEATAAGAAPAPPGPAETPIELTRRLKAENAARHAAGGAAPETPSAPATTRRPIGVTERDPSYVPPAGNAPATPAPEASRPVAAAPQGSRPASPQQQLNEEALARKRAEYQARKATPVETPTTDQPSPSPAAKPKTTNAQAKRYLDLRFQNKTHAQALEILEAETKLAGDLPTDVEVKAAVGERNATGNWPGAAPKPAAGETPTAASPEPPAKSVSPPKRTPIRDPEPIRTIDQAYKGYLIRFNALNGERWIEKGGQAIARGHKSAKDAKSIIDGLTK